jgi:uncharacterized OB-fold protein
MPSPRYWREVPSRFRLEGSRCKSCDVVTFPSRRVCRKCGKAELEAMNLSPTGRVVTSTVIHVSPTDLQMEAPYAMAIVETPEKARLTVQVADCDLDKVKPGMDVRLEFRRIRKEGDSGILCYGCKAVPAD